jgi:hypothetical protein
LYGKPAGNWGLRVIWNPVICSLKRAETYFDCQQCQSMWHQSHNSCVLLDLKIPIYSWGFIRSFHRYAFITIVRFVLLNLIIKIINILIFHYFIIRNNVCLHFMHLCSLVVRVSGYKVRSAGFHSRPYQIF